MEGLYLIVIALLLVFIAIIFVYWQIYKATGVIEDMVYDLKDAQGVVTHFSNTGGIAGEDKHELGSAQAYLFVEVVGTTGITEYWLLTKSQRESMLARTGKNWNELIAAGLV